GRRGALIGGCSIFREENLSFGQASPFLILARDGDQESMRAFVARGYLRRRRDGVIGIRRLAVADGLGEKARGVGAARMAGGGAGEQRGKHHEGSGFPRMTAGEGWLVA